WEAKSKTIDMESFNKGDYLQAIRAGSDAELISKVLYPNDNHVEGKILRLRQQYFLSCASINDVVRRHLAQYGTIDNLPSKVAIHINDTHPTLAIPELMRILLDECGYSWDGAFDLVRHTFAYTNHTVMSEALEKWNLDIFRTTLPRIYEIIKELDKRARAELLCAFPGDQGKVDYMAMIGNNEVRMANICAYVCHSINGVSKLHSQIIKDSVFHDYFLLKPMAFKNVTNGIAYRRWLLQSNPGLTDLCCNAIGDGFKRDASELTRLARYSEDTAFLSQLGAVKHANKEIFASYIEKTTGIVLNTDSIFDVQVKRLHEYKRQHLNALNIVSEYLMLKNNPNADFVPKTYIFGAKAAPGYYMAKQIIRLLCTLGKVIDEDPAVRDKLRIVYLQDYSVTMSERLMPASEISEQISLAGTEASGTGNMKFMLNGAPTLGTLDGANVEICAAAGKQNFFQFGLLTSDVTKLKQFGYLPSAFIADDDVANEVLNFLERGLDGKNFAELLTNLRTQDPYMVMADFKDY
ncbi:MAG: glycogen/starch/alpha-glucan family phosphorylase, partial [Pygmaiobacter sp.]